MAPSRPPEKGGAAEASEMQSGAPRAGDLTPPATILLAEYAEVCKSHAGITDFRAKLLALLPIASGAGIGLLIARESDAISQTAAGLLIGLGIFGAVITVGLFLYELRQIDVCKQLRNHATWIEQQLGIEAGQFGGRRDRLSLHEIYSPTAHRRRDKDLRRLEEAGKARRASTRDRRGFVRKSLVGAEVAGYIIYHAVIITWLLVAAFGIAKLA
jgi:hypothetical protein